MTTLVGSVPAVTRIEPGQRAQQDQALAAAREWGAADGTVGQMVLTHADPGEVCSWCDCTGEAALAGPGDCRGRCAADAVYVITAYAGNPGEYQLLICERHKAEAVALVWVEFRVAVLRGR